MGAVLREEDVLEVRLAADDVDEAALCGQHDHFADRPVDPHAEDVAVGSTSLTPSIDENTLGATGCANVSST